MKNKTLIKTYKGIKIYFNHQDSSLFAKNKKTEETFNGKYIFEIEKQIDEPWWVECDKSGFTVAGVFNNNLYKVFAKRENKKAGIPEWIYDNGTDSSYEKGRKVNRHNQKVTVYPNSKHNIEVYELVKEKQAEINTKKGELRSLINKLNKEI